MPPEDAEDWKEEDKILFLSNEQQYVFLAFLQACMKSGWYKDTMPESTMKLLDRIHNILIESLIENGVLERPEE